MNRAKLVVIIAVLLVVIGVVYVYRHGLTHINRGRAPAKADNTPTGSVLGIVQAPSDTGFKLSSPETSTPYMVTVKPGAMFTREPIKIPYLLKDAAMVNVPATAKDLVAGESVTLTGRADGSNFLADVVTLPRIPYILQGTITSHGTDTMKIDAVPVLEMNPNRTSAPRRESYTIKIDKTTEISRSLGDRKDSVQEFKVTDLNDNQEVVIYATTDVTKSHDITAARIEPIF